MAIPVIFDTDAGSDIDDLYALALILKHPDLDLLGVTTVAGNTQARARLVAKMLRLAGREDVPVCAGIQVPPTQAERGVTRKAYGHDLSHYDVVTRKDPEQKRRFGDAVKFILKTLKSAKEPVTLIGSGPWTNIAEVVRRAGKAERAAIGQLALMGGEVRLMHSESNVRSDPEGAAAVLESGLPLFVGTWSVTRGFFYTIYEIADLNGKARDAFLRALIDATRLWWGKGRTHKPGPVCYDVIPALWAAGERNAFTCVKLDRLPVELNGEQTRGMTVLSPYQLLSAETSARPAPGSILVTREMDAGKVRARFEELVFGG